MAGGGKKTFVAIQQGVGRMPKKPFGNGSKASKKWTKKKKGGPKGAPVEVIAKQAFDALHPRHLPLPRAVGGHTNITVTDIFQFSKMAVIGFTKSPAEDWTNVYAYSPVDPALAMNASLNTVRHSFTALESDSWLRANVVPEAMTIQVMNPSALQTTSGIIRIGRAKQVLNVIGRTDSWNVLAKEWISYSEPRLCSAGKLALRGVQSSLVPYNMSEISDWSELSTLPDSSSVTLIQGQAPFTGFAPFLIFTEDDIALQIQVSATFRVRFDPQNPAYAAHRQQGVASDSMWSKCISALERGGHGVEDIVERVAQFGQAAGTAAAVGSAVGLL